MTTIKIHPPVYWNHKQAAKLEKKHAWDKLVVFAHTQVKNEIPMFKNLVAVQCVLFLPLLALLVLGLHSPVSLILVIVALFLANIIISAGGSGMRAINSIFALGILNLLTLALLLV
jgi:hypothetical protein